MASALRWRIVRFRSRRMAVSGASRSGSDGPLSRKFSQARPAVQSGSMRGCLCCGEHAEESRQPRPGMQASTDRKPQGRLASLRRPAIARVRLLQALKDAPYVSVAGVDGRRLRSTKPRALPTWLQDTGYTYSPQAGVSSRACRVTLFAAGKAYGCAGTSGPKQEWESCGFRTLTRTPTAIGVTSEWWNSGTWTSNRVAYRCGL